MDESTLLVMRECLAWMSELSAEDLMPEHGDLARDGDPSSTAILQKFYKASKNFAAMAQGGEEGEKKNRALQSPGREEVEACYLGVVKLCMGELCEQDGAWQRECRQTLLHLKTWPR
mmetsp:Transcript_19017/g.62516  ORF Transcript_19017/g.62516 Transcript_19017/m.62516 type:complete len:117 (+) Transcript_19017:174-524(+)